MKKVSIAIVNSSSFGQIFTDHIKRLEEFAVLRRIEIPNHSAPEVFHQKLHDVDGIIASVTPYYSKEVLMGLPNLRFLARHGVGCDNVDLKTCTNLGIPVSKVGPEVEREAVAQMTMALMHAAARQIVNGSELVRAGRWSERARLNLGVDFAGATVGLIGIGAIGSTVARILSQGYQANVLAYDPYLTEAEVSSRHATKTELNDLISRSDIISIHCPLTDETRRLFNAQRLHSMKDKVIIVNTTRGEIFDQDQLITALNSGKIAGYATDVVEGEPINEDHILLKTKNVIITPHLGGYSAHSLRGMGETMVSDMHKVFVKQIPPGVIANPEIELANSRIASQALHAIQQANQ